MGCMVAFRPSLDQLHKDVGDLVHILSVHPRAITLSPLRSLTGALRAAACVLKGKGWCILTMTQTTGQQKLVHLISSHHCSQQRRAGTMCYSPSDEWLRFNNKHEVTEP